MKMPLKNEDEIKTSSDMQKLKEFITTRPALQEMLKRNSFDRRKIIPDGNMDLYKRMKSARNTMCEI
jgi:hypothetical protein